MLLPQEQLVGEFSVVLRGVDEEVARVDPGSKVWRLPAVRPTNIVECCWVVVIKELNVAMGQLAPAVACALLQVGGHSDGLSVWIALTTSCNTACAQAAHSPGNACELRLQVVLLVVVVQR